MRVQISPFAPDFLENDGKHPPKGGPAHFEKETDEHLTD
jgi:hypothetical protein